MINLSGLIRLLLHDGKCGQCALGIKRVFFLAPSSLRLVSGHQTRLDLLFGPSFSFDVPSSPPATFLRFSHRKADTREEND